MSNEIIDAAMEDDVIALKKAFDDAMVPKIAAAIEMKKQQLAADVFGDDEPEDEDEDEVEEEDEETDDDETD